MHISIILPVFNEEENLPPLLSRIVSLSGLLSTTYGALLRLILVDDGSTDDSPNIIARFQNQNAIPAVLLSHERNRGLGYALRTGLAESLNAEERADVIVVMDSDNTHNPFLIVDMLQSVKDGADVVIASRYQKGGIEIGVPLMRKMISRFGNIGFCALFKFPGVRDYTSGYRMIRLSIIRCVAKKTEQLFFQRVGFASMAELLLNIGICTKKFYEVPLVLRYDQKHGRSKMLPLQTIVEYFFLLCDRFWVSKN